MVSAGPDLSIKGPRAEIFRGPYDIIIEKKQVLYKAATILLFYYYIIIL